MIASPGAKQSSKPSSRLHHTAANPPKSAKPKPSLRLKPSPKQALSPPLRPSQSRVDQRPRDPLALPLPLQPFQPSAELPPPFNPMNLQPELFQRNLDAANPFRPNLLGGMPFISQPPTFPSSFGPGSSFYSPYIPGTNGTLPLPSPAAGGYSMPAPCITCSGMHQWGHCPRSMAAVRLVPAKPAPPGMPARNYRRGSSSNVEIVSKDVFYGPRKRE